MPESPRVKNRPETRLGAPGLKNASPTPPHAMATYTVNQLFTNIAENVALHDYHLSNTRMAFYGDGALVEGIDSTSGVDYSIRVETIGEQRLLSGFHQRYRIEALLYDSKGDDIAQDYATTMGLLADCEPVAADLIISLLNNYIADDV